MAFHGQSLESITTGNGIQDLSLSNLTHHSFPFVHPLSFIQPRILLKMFSQGPVFPSVPLSEIAFYTRFSININLLWSFPCFSPRSVSPTYPWAPTPAQSSSTISKLPGGPSLSLYPSLPLVWELLQGRARPTHPSVLSTQLTVGPGRSLTNLWYTAYCPSNS